jgi:serine/threonine protein kinase
MKLGLPTGTEADKAGASKPASDVPTSATPPGGFVPPAPTELATQFPQLDIIELLGQGGMGAVYKARQKQLERLVALKILPPEVGRTEAFAERFAREARSLAKLSHPRIVSVHDFGHTEEGLYYFIMEFIDGTDLRRMIQSGKLSPAEALAIVPQVCEALQFAHEEGIVHRDVKPENILLDKKGRVKIADFGLAKLLDRPATAYTLTQAGQRMGTPHYMAPEQIEHPGQVDHRADIYSLGVVFYEMLTGELPLGLFAPPSQKVQVDVRLDKVVLHSLEKEPERRYQHASEVKSDVEIISAELKAPIQPTPRAPAPVNPMEKHISIVSALRIGFGIMGVLVAIIVFPVLVGGGRLSDDPEVIRITSIIGPAVAVFLTVGSVPGI